MLSWLKCISLMKTQRNMVPFESKNLTILGNDAELKPLMLS